MFDWMERGLSQTDPTAPVTPTPAGGQDILNNIAGGDPALSAALNSFFTGSDVASQAQPKTLPELLADTAMSITGREGVTGQPYDGPLPAWAADLSPKALKNPDFDPYLGIVSQEGDERVFMGGTKDYTPTPDTITVTQDDPARQSGDGVDFRSGATPPPQEKKRKDKSGVDDKTLTVYQAMNLPYTWDEEQITDAMKKMRQAGIPVTTFDGSNGLLSVWGSLVQRAAMTYATTEGARKVTPWDMLDLYKSEAKAAGAYQNYEQTMNGSKTTVQRTVSDVTEGEAWSMLQQNLSRMLGRDPSDQEVRDFTYKMNQLAAANPAISKTITQYKNGEAVSSSTKTSGGFTSADAAQAAYEEAQSNPEYAEYQSATTYFNAAMSALGAIGQT